MMSQTSDQAAMATPPYTCLADEPEAFRAADTACCDTCAAEYHKNRLYRVSGTVQCVRCIHGRDVSKLS